MRKSSNLFFPIVLLFCLLSIGAQAQNLNNSIDLHAGAILGAFSGTPLLKEGTSIVSPSLFNNYSSMNGVGLKASFRLNSLMGLSVGISSHSGANWKNDISKLYDESGVFNRMASLGVQLNTPFSNFGPLNYFRFYLDLSPGIGLSTLKLENPVSYIISPGNSINYPRKETTVYYALALSAGMKVRITNRSGIFISVSRQENLIDGSLFNDTRFRSNQLDLGLFFRLREDKRFYNNFR